MKLPLNGIVIAIAIVIVAVVANSSATQFAKNNAIDGCGYMASNVKKGDFITSIYKFCMVDKGYETTAK